jgi:hypothetical protein
MSYLNKLQLYDASSNKTALVTQMREMKVSSSIRLVGTPFFGTANQLDTNFWAATPAPTGTGSYTLGTGEIVLQTGTTANSSVTISSVRTSRYIPSNSNSYRAILSCTGTSDNNNTRRWGAFDASDGVFFQLVGTTLSLVARSNTVDTPIVSSGSFNGGNFTSYTVDGNVHRWEIMYTNSAINFYVDELLIHKYTASTAPWSTTLSLKVMASNVNTNNGTANTTIKVRVASIVRLGEATSRPNWRNFTGAVTDSVLKYGPGTLQKVCINTKGSNNARCTLYDALTATNPIAVIDTYNVIGSISYDLDFFTGLTITTTANVGDVTIIYE